MSMAGAARSGSRLRRWEAVVLAAGASRRMGRPKALLPWAGTSLLSHQLRSLLATRIRRVVLVLGAHVELLRSVQEVQTYGAQGLVRTVVNEAWTSGKCGSIRVGAEALGGATTDIVLLAVDQPTCAEVLEALMGAHELSGRLATLPEYRGKRGHPILLSTKLLPELVTLREEEHGMRALIARLELDMALHVEPLGAPCVRWDLNRPEDVRSVMSRRRG